MHERRLADRLPFGAAAVVATHKSRSIQRGPREKERQVSKIEDESLLAEVSERLAAVLAGCRSLVRQNLGEENRMERFSLPLPADASVCLLSFLLVSLVGSLDCRLLAIRFDFEDPSCAAWLAVSERADVQKHP